jgi:poly(ADP-ribose) glycohydrolase ARH3
MRTCPCHPIRRYNDVGMAQAPAPSLLDRFRGCILGQAVGDALGAPFETMPASAIYYQFGFARKIVAHPPVDKLEYTDDTQMMIGVAETLVAQGRIDQEHLMSAFVANFDAARAYGPGTHQIIEVASTGGDWRTLAETIFPGGSLGNGAAMRVAPVGLLFHHDLDQLDEQAVLSAVPTHTHPVGIDAARLLATAIAYVIREPAFDPASFFAELQRRAATEEFADAIARAAGLISSGDIGLLGTSLEANRSVTTALACFASYPDSYSDAVGRAIGLGGDTDTISAIVGALSGARLGAQSVPAHLIAMLEDELKGRSYLDDLAQRLHAQWEQGKSGPLIE